MTRQSIAVAMKQRNASAGVQTIGSPRTLNEVLTSTGTPVLRSNASIRSANAAFVRTIDRLDARAAVDVRHRWQRRPNGVQTVQSLQPVRVGEQLLPAPAPRAACRGSGGRSSK